MYVLPTSGLTRAAFVCGRKVGGAVERNRARRILREAWRSLAGTVRSGHDVVFVARPEIVGASMFLLENTGTSGVNLAVDGGWLLR